MKVLNTKHPLILNFIGKLLKVYSYIIFFSCVFTILATITYLFAPISSFSITQDSNQWLFTFKNSNNQAITSIVSFLILQELPTEIINPKYSMILYNLVKVLPSQLCLFIGIKIILSILDDILVKNIIFSKNHVKKIKIIAIFFIIYYALIDMILNIAFIFISDHFLIQLDNIHLEGFLIGGVIYLIAEIYYYGTFLQSEYNLTL